MDFRENIFLADFEWISNNEGYSEKIRKKSERKNYVQLGASGSHTLKGTINFL